MGSLNKKLVKEYSKTEMEKLIINEINN